MSYARAFVILFCLVGVVSASSDDDLIQVKVDFGGKTFDLAVDKSSTVLELKQMISLNEDVPLAPEDLSVSITDGGAPSYMQDDEKLEHYFTSDKVEVTASKKISNFFFGVDADDEEAKRKILRDLADDNFKEMFGNDIDPADIVFHESSESEKSALMKKVAQFKEIFSNMYTTLTGKLLKKDEQKMEDQKKYEPIEE